MNLAVTSVTLEARAQVLYVCDEIRSLLPKEKHDLVAGLEETVLSAMSVAEAAWDVIETNERLRRSRPWPGFFGGRKSW